MRWVIRVVKFDGVPGFLWLAKDEPRTWVITMIRAHATVFKTKEASESWAIGWKLRDPHLADVEMIAERQV